MNTLKFSVFTDMHHAPGELYSRAKIKLPMIQQRAKDNHCEFIIHAGDLTKPSQEKEFVDQYLDFEIPSYSCLGNHDSDFTSFEETVEIYRMPNDYYYFDQSGFRIVVLNLNYYESNGVAVPYSLGNYYSTTGSVGMMPEKEMIWLENLLAESPYPCILISHQSLERSNGILNAKEVREIINAANRRRKYSVMLCINGHYHMDYMRLLDNVLYFDLNSCSYDWIDVVHHLYPEQMEKEYIAMSRTVNYDIPVHAVITISDNGEINIEGMKGKYFMDVGREAVGVPLYDAGGRLATPNVSSAHIQLL